MSISDTSLQERYQKVQNDFQLAHKINPDARLLAVSKTRDAEEIRQIHTLGQKAFGENYLQEGLEKIQQLSELDIEWHFIGPLQSNKTRSVAENFQWLHTLDRLKVAQRLNNQRPENQTPLNVCIQVNLDNEPTKSGVSLQDIPSLANEIANLSNLKLRGLMAIPRARKDYQEQFDAVATLSEALEHLKQQFKNDPRVQLDTLSIGMSNDMEAALAAGSSMVRIGTAIFGPRPNKQ